MSYGPDQILEGEGNSDYERYIRTSELLRLQKGPDEWVSSRRVALYRCAPNFGIMVETCHLRDIAKFGVFSGK